MNRLVPPESSTSLVDYIANSVQQMILSGELAPDEPVNINALAKQTNVSLVPVREALARLSATGLLRFVPNRGYRVAPRLDASARGALFEVRELLELSATSLATEKRTAAELRELRQINDAIKALKRPADQDVHKFFQLNDKFHSTYLAMTKNPYLLRLFESLSFDLLMAREVSSPIDVPRLTEEHDRIIEAISDRQPDLLRELLTSHIRSTL